jgi:hypothetical protein
VEHAVSFDAIRPWRTAALVAAAVAALELVLIIAGAAVVLAKPATHARHAAPAARTHHRRVPRPAVRHTLLTRARTPILVLNGNGRQGAAAAEAAQVRMHGYPIRAVGNAARQATGPTAVMYAPGLRPEAQRLARDVAIRVVAPLDGMRIRDLRGARLAIILGD